MDSAVSALAAQKIVASLPHAREPLRVWGKTNILHKCECDGVEVVDGLCVSIGIAEKVPVLNEFKSSRQVKQDLRDSNIYKWRSA